MWKLLQQSGFEVKKVDHFDREEPDWAFESTGVLIIDRKLKRAYVGLSNRASYPLAQKWGKKYGFEMVTFKTSSKSGMVIYHTNVMLSVCDSFAIVCDDLIVEEDR